MEKLEWKGKSKQSHYQSHFLDSCNNNTSTKEVLQSTTQALKKYYKKLEFVRVPALLAEQLLILHGFAYDNELSP